jgi:Flp pilus assembly pilin Flp
MRKLSGMRVTRVGAQALAEYALILALIVIVAIVILAVLGKTIAKQFSTVNSGISN